MKQDDVVRLDLLREPDINAPTLPGQIQQIKECLADYAKRMNYNLWEIDRRLKEMENNGKKV